MTEEIKPRILVVDDRPDNLVVMEAVLKDLDYEVVMVSSGAEAIAKVEQTEFALILLDIQMPTMDGYETAARIKAMERGKDVPIIMVTAIYTEDPHVVKGYRSGAVDYIGKPFNPEILRAKVGIYANMFVQSKQIVRQNKYLLEVEKVLTETTHTRAVLDVLPVGVIVADRSGTIVQMNKEARAIWCGERLVDIAHYQEYRGAWAGNGKPLLPHDWALARAIEKGERSQYEIIHIECFDGARKTILNSASPIRKADGSISGAVDVVQDISQSKELSSKVVTRLVS